MHRYTIDGGHAGTAIYWSEARRQYVAVHYDSDEVTYHDEIVLVRGGDWEGSWLRFAPAGTHIWVTVSDADGTEVGQRVLTVGDDEDA